MPCDRCFYLEDGKKVYYECYCEADRKQVEEDDKRATKDGYVCLNGRWIKQYKRKVNPKKIEPTSAPDLLV